MALSDQTSRVRAEIRARQAEDGRKAMAEYHADAVAVRAKTERLRALRLAREAEARAKPASVEKARAGAKVTKTRARAPKIPKPSAS